MAIVKLSGLKPRQVGRLEIWDLRAKTAILAFSGHDADIDLVRWIDDRCVLTASQDLSLIEWDVRLRPGPRALECAAEILLLSPEQADSAVEELIGTLEKDFDQRIASEEILVALGNRAIPAITARIRGCLERREPLSPKISEACRDLADDVPETRAAAMARLRTYGIAAIPHLRAAARAQDREARAFAQSLLDESIGWKPDQDWRVALLAVDLLEWIGTPSAGEALGRMAADPRFHWVADAAKSSLLRMSTHK